MKEGLSINKTPELPFPEEKKITGNENFDYKQESLVKCTQSFRNQPDRQIFIQIKSIALLPTKKRILEELKEVGFLEDEGENLRVEETISDNGTKRFYIWLISPKGTMIDSRNTTIDSKD